MATDDSNEWVEPGSSGEPATSGEPVQKPGTTHAGYGEGNPHLAITSTVTDERFDFALTSDVVRIGSAPDADLRLDGADPVHAEIRHDDNDEYILTLFGGGETSVIPAVVGSGVPQLTAILRAGAHFTPGPWRVVYTRAEFADHGRPYGGRQGGEGEHQPRQPPRPDYS